MMNTDIALRFVYTTLDTRAAADAVAEALVARQLAACVNIVGPIASVYRWEGKTVREQEYALWIKTTAERVHDTMAALAEAHPYDTPAIAVFDAHAHGNDYINWLAAGTSVAG